MLTLPRPAIAVVAIATALRLWVAFHFPLTEDESYYWTWSRHLAFGYVDHPPMVAWLIALTAPLGRSSGLIRLPFILCEGATALLLARTVQVLGGESAAATAAAVAFTAIPQIRLAIGEALPDGPYLLCWALALLFAAKLARPVDRAAVGDGVALGLALGGALLSRIFGWALLLGILAFALAPRQRRLWRRALPIALVVTLVLYAPFLAWNAVHHWVNFAFAVRDRQQFGAFSVEHVSVLSSTRFLVYALGVWIVGFGVALRPRRALIAWTALPFPTFLALLSFFESVESYWLLGPFTSLCAGIGLSSGRLASRWRRLLLVLVLPAVYTAFSALFVALPENDQRALLHQTHGGLQALYSGAYAYRPLAQDARVLSQQRTALVLTDQFEIVSELAYYGLDSLQVGSSAHAQQSLAWQGSVEIPPRVLVITLSPLGADEILQRRLASSFVSVRSGPVLRYAFAGVEAMTWYTTWCAQPRANARTTLFAPDLTFAAARA